MAQQRREAKESGLDRITLMVPVELKAQLEARVELGVRTFSDVVRETIRRGLSAAEGHADEQKLSPLRVRTHTERQAADTRPWMAGDLAKAMGCSRPTIDDALKKGLIPHVRLGRRIFIPHRVALALLNGEPLYPPGKEPK